MMWQKIKCWLGYHPDYSHHQFIQDEAVRQWAERISGQSIPMLRAVSYKTCYACDKTFDWQIGPSVEK